MFILPISDEKKKIVLHVEQMQNKIALQVVQGLDSFLSSYVPLFILLLWYFVLN